MSVEPHCHHSPLISGYGHPSNCTSRRCLAEMLIDKSYLSQPQYMNCTLPVLVPFIEYQTLAVVSILLKNLIVLIIRMKNIRHVDYIISSFFL